MGTMGLSPEERLEKMHGYLNEKDGRIEQLTREAVCLEGEVDSQTILIRELNEDLEDNRVHLKACKERLRVSRIRSTELHDELAEQKREILDLKRQLGTKTTECLATVYGLGCLFDELKESRELVENWIKECKRLRTAEIK